MRAPAILAALLLATATLAQAQAPSAAPAAAAAPVAAPVGGIQGQNILDVKPEVRPDAPSDPNYLKQTNGERQKVQPGNNAPAWRAVQQGQAGISSLPFSEAPEAGVLIQPPVQYPGSPRTTAGEAWRQVRNHWILPYGGALFLIALGALAIFYFTRGTIRQHGTDTGRKIERFTPFERSAHWANAIAFCILGVSGLVMAFGRFILLPVIGGTLFGWLTYALKTMHNFAGPVFAVSLVIVFITFVKDNLPQRGDLHWALKAGGLFSSHGEEPASWRFNAGEKVVFWGGVFLLGIVVVSSGFVLDKLVPGLVYERGSMQIAHMVHAVATVLMLCMFAGHIYIGSIGMEGAYDAMKTGYVDETWAREHHRFWYEQVESGEIPAQRSRPAVPEKPAAAT